MEALDEENALVESSLFEKMVPDLWLFVMENLSLEDLRSLRLTEKSWVLNKKINEFFKNKLENPLINPNAFLSYPALKAARNLVIFLHNMRQQRGATHSLEMKDFFDRIKRQCLQQQRIAGGEIALHWNNNAELARLVNAVIDVKPMYMSLWQYENDVSRELNLVMQEGFTAEDISKELHAKKILGKKIGRACLTLGLILGAIGLRELISRPSVGASLFLIYVVLPLLIGGGALCSNLYTDFTRPSTVTVAVPPVNINNNNNAVEQNPAQLPAQLEEVVVDSDSEDLSTPLLENQDSPRGSPR